MSVLLYTAIALSALTGLGVLVYVWFFAGSDDAIEPTPWDDFNTAEQDPPAKFRREGKA